MKQPIDESWVVRFEDVSKTFSGARVLSGVTLELQPGRIHALVGQNGSGKSTLIKILSGYHDADPGSRIQIGTETLPLGSPVSSYRLGCRFVHQDLGLVDTASVVDNMSLLSGFPTRLGTVRNAASIRAAKSDLAQVGSTIDPKRIVGTLAPTQRTELAIARAVRRDPSAPAKLLVLDEPTATLPPAEVRHLFRTIRAVAASGVAVLFVSHHIGEVFTMGDDISVLRDGRLVWTSSVNEVSRDKLLHHLFGATIRPLARDRTQKRSADNEVLVVDDLHGDELKGVSLRARAGEILGIAGLTGSGRETLLPTVFGALTPTHGQITVSGNTLTSGAIVSAIQSRVAYMPPNRRDAGVMTMSAFDNLTLPRLTPHWTRARLRRSGQRSVTREWFARLGVRPAEAVSWPLERFSGGNQQKVLLGKWLSMSPTLLLLDEPTQGVDAQAKNDLHAELLKVADAGSAVVISSTDIDELSAICDRVLVLSEGSVINELVGDDVSSVKVAAAFMPLATAAKS